LEFWAKDCRRLTQKAKAYRIGERSYCEKLMASCPWLMPDGGSVLATEERGADQRKSSREEEREFGRRTGYSMRELLCLFIHAGALLLLSS